MSAVTDRLTPEDIAVIARIIFNVRQRRARAAREEADSAAPAPPRGEQGSGEDAA